MIEAKITLTENFIKKPYVKLLYNGYNVSADFSPYVTTVTYTDYEKEQSDELSVSLSDHDGHFVSDWHPKKGDKITAVFGFEGENTLKCGTFTIDELSYNFDTSGDTCEIQALAATTNSPVRTKNSRFFENKTLVQIARYFGDLHGFKVVGSEGNVNVGRQNQFDETDLSFLARIARNYGYIFKLTDGLLTFTSVDGLTSAKALFTLERKDLQAFSVSNASTKKYKACSVKYFNPKTKKLCTYTAKRADGTDTLKLAEHIGSKAEAMRIATANLKAGSKEITGSVTLSQANVLFCAGVNCYIKGFAAYDGLYHITSATHTMSASGWEVSGEVEKCT